MNERIVLPQRVLRIGCLGLSANPPHNGHLMVARFALESNLVDCIFFIPVFQHPFVKKGLAPWGDRLAMTRLLIEGEQNMFVSTIEQELGGLSYTWRTLVGLQEQYPECEFSWIVGADIIASGRFGQWKNWQLLERSARFIVAPRMGYWFFAAGLPRCFTVIQPKAPEDRYPLMLSSTLVRAMVRRGQDITRAVGEGIAEYIRTYGLYQETEGE